MIKNVKQSTKCEYYSSKYGPYRFRFSFGKLIFFSEILIVVKLVGLIKYVNGDDMIKI